MEKILVRRFYTERKKDKKYFIKILQQSVLFFYNPPFNLIINV